MSGQTDRRGARPRGLHYGAGQADLAGDRYDEWASGRVELSAYAGEMAWREDKRRVSNGEQYLAITEAALRHPVSRVWKGTGSEEWREKSA